MQSPKRSKIYQHAALPFQLWRQTTHGGGCSRLPCVASWGLCSLICKWVTLLKDGSLWRRVDELVPTETQLSSALGTQNTLCTHHLMPVSKRLRYSGSLEHLTWCPQNFLLLSPSPADPTWLRTASFSRRPDTPFRKVLDGPRRCLRGQRCLQLSLMT